MSKSKIVYDSSEIDWERVRAELADSIQAAKDENITLIVHDSDTGAYWRITPDGKVAPHDQGPSQTDWARVLAKTDEEIEAAIASDPDEADLGDDWMERGIVVGGKGKEVAKGVG